MQGAYDTECNELLWEENLCILYMLKNTFPLGTAHVIPLIKGSLLQQIYYNPSPAELGYVLPLQTA